MKPKRLIPAIARLSLLVAGLVVIWTPSLVFSQATDPDDATCLGCHDGLDVSLRPTIHRLASELKSSKSGVACVSCHPGGATHIDNPSAETIGNPARMTGFDALRQCSSCHVPHPEMSNFGRNGHNLQQQNCSSCHKVHAGKNSLLRDDQAKFCLDCHQDVKTQFIRRSAHPIRKLNVTCISCHSMSQASDMEPTYSLNRVCEDCHSDLTGPYLYEHETVHGWSPEGTGCNGCHNPHGSENDKLLRQPSDQMCRQCHAVPGHAVAPTLVAAHTLVAPDGNFSRFACIECHADVHGSNSNDRLLDPDLPARLGVGCSCHGLE